VAPLEQCVWCGTFLTVHTACCPAAGTADTQGLLLVLLYCSHPLGAIVCAPARNLLSFLLLSPSLQMWHWGEKRRLAQYYSELYAKEKADEDAFTDELRAKIKALEEELLG